MEIKRDQAKGFIEMSQNRYIKEIAERFGMSDCKPVNTPMTGSLLRGDPEAGAKADTLYMGMVGSLLYVAMVSRPDIALAVQVLAGSLQAFGPEHIQAAKRVIRYLVGKAHLTLRYGQVSQDDDVLGHCDSDYTGDVQTRRSTTASRLLDQRRHSLVGKQASADCCAPDC
jgi:hypothetical protein